jgi:hypothetical protein
MPKAPYQIKSQAETVAAVEAAGKKGITYAALAAVLGVSLASATKRCAMLRVEGRIQARSGSRSALQFGLAVSEKDMNSSFAAHIAPALARREARLKRRRISLSQEIARANAIARSVFGSGGTQQANQSHTVTETWCDPSRHYVHKQAPGRFEVLEAPACFGALPPGQYAFEPASVAARVKA